ncbi:MAG: HAD family phosphatase [Candidatus Kapabacteria bacterium]|nr:HAD family phosphatase [Candidatus Kapabacteria bacterium]
MIDKQNIKLIILDYGGVLYEINLKRMMSEFGNLSSNKDTIRSEAINELIINYEEGKIETNNFRAQAKELLGISAPDVAFDKAWLSILVAEFPESIGIVSQLQKVATLALLSNTSALHYSKFSVESKELFEYFDKIFLSFQVGATKPKPEIYQSVLDHYNLIPEDCFFVDDDFNNIEGARKLGFKVFHINENNRLSDFLHMLNE